MKLGEILISKGYITETELKEGLEIQKKVIAEKNIDLIKEFDQFSINEYLEYLDEEAIELLEVDLESNK